MLQVEAQRAAVRSLTDDELVGKPPMRMLIAREGRMEIYYALFESMNTAARIILVGITPGLQQMLQALRTCRAALNNGQSADAASRAGKSTAAFCGAMRSNLVRMLDRFRFNELLAVSTCGELFGACSDLIHSTSVIRYPAFVDGKNYNGQPPIHKSRLLNTVIRSCLVPELEALPSALIVPLGPFPTEALESLVREGVLDSARVLSGLVHPSGANNERINYLLGLKRRDRLSAKTNPVVLDRGRERLSHAVEMAINDRATKLPPACVAD